MSPRTPKQLKVGYYPQAHPRAPYRIKVLGKYKWFLTEQDARDAASDSGQGTVPVITKAKLAQYQFCEELLEGVPVLTAVRFYQEHHPKTRTAVTVKDALESFRLRYDDSGRRPRRVKYLDELDRNLKRIGDHLGSKLVASVTDLDLEAMLATYDGRFAKWDLWKFTRMFFTWAKQKRMLVEDPCEFVDAPEPPSASNGILTPPQTQRVIDVCTERFPELLPAVALQLFGGIRTEEIEHLDWSQIRPGLSIHVERAKLHARPRTIDFWPANLGTLLLGRREKYPESGRVAPKNYLKAKGDLLAAVTIDESGRRLFSHPQNAFRHNYASYGCAFFQSGDRIATQLGHRNARMLFQTYRDSQPWLTQEIGRLYFNLVPRSFQPSFDGAACAIGPCTTKPKSSPGSSSP